jgi:hypothetical protein
MAFSDDVTNSQMLLQAELKAAANQAAVNTAYINHYRRIVTAEEAWPGNTAGALAVLQSLNDPTVGSRGHKK